MDFALKRLMVPAVAGDRDRALLFFLVLKIGEQVFELFVDAGIA